jgi:hypothetical protein
MKKAKTIEPARQADEAVFPTRLCRTTPLLCEQCTSGMLLLEEAVAIAGVSSRTLHRFVEAGALHFAETPDGLLLLCLNSLLAQRELERNTT